MTQNSNLLRAIQPAVRELKVTFYLLNRNLLQRISMVIILLLILIAIFAPVIAPYPGHAISDTNRR